VASLAAFTATPERLTQGPTLAAAVAEVVALDLGVMVGPVGLVRTGVLWALLEQGSMVQPIRALAEAEAAPRGRGHLLLAPEVLAAWAGLAW
jgi:hypothetical protein